MSSLPQLPPGPPFYPDGELTDEPEEVLMAEFIREAALEGVRDELPHSLAVVIDEVSPREGRDDLIDVHAVLFVERDSQKGIVIGKGGARLREVGTAARARSRSCWAPRSTSTCASRLRRTGSATLNSLADLAFEVDNAGYRSAGPLETGGVPVPVSVPVFHHTAGCLAAQPPSASNSAASDTSSGSLLAGPISCTPIGKPVG